MNTINADKLSIDTTEATHLLIVCDKITYTIYEFDSYSDNNSIHINTDDYEFVVDVSNFELDNDSYSDADTAVLLLNQFKQ